MHIHCIQHVPIEGPAAIADWAAARGHALTAVHPYAGDALPAPGAVEWLLVMGGPMSVHDAAAHPWLAAEQAFLAQAIERGATAIGVCLGAQLLAQALGAPVRRAPFPEIGWLPVELSAAGRASPLLAHLPPVITVFQWHGDAFDLPPGAVQLARSAGCEQQAFLWGGRVLGLQFHLESTPESVALLCEHCAGEIVPGPWVQNAARMRAAPAARYRRANAALSGVLDRLAAERCA